VKPDATQMWHKKDKHKQGNNLVKNLEKIISESTQVWQTGNESFGNLTPGKSTPKYIDIILQMT